MTMSVNTFNQAVNLKVKVTTLLDQQITGYIYTFSSSNEILSLKTPNNSYDSKKSSSSNQRSDTYRIINTAFIKAIQVLTPLPKKINSNNVINKHMQVTYTNVSIEELERHLNDAIKNYKKSPKPTPESHNHNHNPNPNPSPNQITSKLLEKLKKKFGANNVKKLPGSDILVFDEIKLSKPYTLAKSGNIQLLKGTSAHYTNVQKALKEFWLEDTNERRGG